MWNVPTPPGRMGLKLMQSLIYETIDRMFKSTQLYHVHINSAISCSYQLSYIMFISTQLYLLIMNFLVANWGRLSLLPRPPTSSSGFLRDLRFKYRHANCLQQPEGQRKQHNLSLQHQSPCQGKSSVSYLDRINMYFLFISR